MNNDGERGPQEIAHSCVASVGTECCRLIPALLYPHRPSSLRDGSPVKSDKNMPSHKSAASNLHGKTVLITGASSGIGRSTALEFARTSSQSLKLVLTARRVDRLHELAAQIRSEVGDGVEVFVKQLDVSRPTEIEAMFEEQGLPERFREVDVLVNNACVFLCQVHFFY